MFDTSFADAKLLDAHVDVLDEARVVHLSGELDGVNRTRVMRMCTDGEPSSVIVDLTELTFMDCAGYGGFVEAQLDLVRRGGSLTFSNPVGEPARLLELLELTPTQK